ncbi:MAG: tetratricopeptide repeat protein [Armatimonadetes bacterium]|nr:tetratricopeptide repeat protein [Armatimonadota bacterium]
MKTSTVILALVSLTIAGCAPQGPTEARRLDLKRVQAQGDSRADRMIAAAQKFVARHPDKAKGYNDLGQALMQRAREHSALDDYAGALAAFENAVALEPKDPVSLHNLAWCWTMFHSFDKARDLADKALAQNPIDPFAYGVKFDSEMELGRYKEAGASAQKMLDLRPDLASYSRAAQYRWSLGDAKGAVLLMEKAADAGAPFGENTLWCMTQVGDLAFKTGNVAAAGRAYQRALDRDPQYRHALFGMGRVRFSQRKDDEGMDFFAKALDQKCPALYRIEYASLLAKAGRRDEAAKQHQMVDDIIKEHLSYGIHGDEVVQAENWLAQGIKLKEALELMTSEAKEHTNWQTYSALAWAQLANGRSSDAAATIRKGLASGVQEPVLWARAGRIAEAAGQVDEGRTRLAAAENLSPYLASLVESPATKVASR